MYRKGTSQLIVIILVILLSCSTKVLAHVEEGVTGGLLSGLLHPVLGFDHLVAMLAVGLWGSQLGQPSIWLLPIVFPLIMAVGGLLGMLGIDLQVTELAIALSAITLGLVIVFSFKAHLVLASIIVGIFGLFHGHAHGTEMPQASNALAYGTGFVVSTGFLHLAGILVGEFRRLESGKYLIRGLGACISLIGIYFVTLNYGLL